MSLVLYSAERDVMLQVPSDLMFPVWRAKVHSWGFPLSRKKNVSSVTTAFHSFTHRSFPPRIFMPCTQEIALCSHTHTHIKGQDPPEVAVSSARRLGCLPAVLSAGLSPLIPAEQRWMWCLLRYWHRRTFTLQRTLCYVTEQRGKTMSPLLSYERWPACVEIQ